MKPFWISLSIIIAMFTAFFLNGQYLDRFLSPLEDQLLAAEEAANAEDWDAASAMTQEVKDAWFQKHSYLHITLRHLEIDQTQTSLEQVLSYLEHQSLENYAAANAALIRQLELIRKMESLNIENLL